MIKEKAKGFLVDNFGNLTSTGGVYFNKEKEKVIIKVPVEDLPEIKIVAKDILVL
ncbi:MAG: hypothetical protein ACNYVW_07145 [Methanosarcinales archaeon]